MDSTPDRNDLAESTKFSRGCAAGVARLPSAAACDQDHKSGDDSVDGVAAVFEFEEGLGRGGFEQRGPVRRSHSPLKPEAPPFHLARWLYWAV